MKKLSLTLLIVLVSLLVTATNYAQQRTIYYLPYMTYKIKADLNKPDRYNMSNYKIVVFLGTVKSVTCSKEHPNGSGLINALKTQFQNHIEAYHRGKLGPKYWASEASGFWRFDNPKEVVGVRAAVAKRYGNNLVYINDFTFYCR